MGTDKALLRLDGEAMVDRIGAVVRAAGCQRVVAIGPAHLAGGLESVADRSPGEGPLGGVITALIMLGEHASAVLVVACDMPWLDVAAVQVLVDAAGQAAGSMPPVDVVMAQTDRLEPLCALWSPSSLGRLQLAFGAGERAIHRALGGLTVLRVALPGDALRNVNTPDDLPRR
ncbi:unannotated protein [freshwater metagenome]|uniref:Unannotated protein n=1 Tax=freshwater metagenome TaxID=449393 RepID=A0A6J7DV15_9ZZZZ